MTVPGKEVRRRRSKAEIAAEKAAKAERQAARQVQREARQREAAARLKAKAGRKARAAAGSRSIERRVERMQPQLRSTMDRWSKERRAEEARAVERKVEAGKRSKREAEAFSRVQLGQRPDLKGLADLDVARIASPYAGRVTDPDQAVRGVPVLKSLRDDPLGRLAKRRQVTSWEEAAGRLWQEWWEAAEIGGARAIDTTKESVDGRKFVDSFDERQQKALKMLASCTKWLGVEGDALVHDVLGRRMFITQVAAARGITGEEGQRYLARRFRECLGTIARKTRLAPQPDRRVLDKHDALVRRHGMRA